MTDCPADESHSKWVRAFSRWFHTSKRDWIVENLHDGTALSPKDSRFLAAILAGTVRPLSGKQGTAARLRNSAINDKIWELHARGEKRADILAALKAAGLLESWVAISGLNQRMDRPAKRMSEQRMDRDKEIAALYEKITAM